MSKRSKAYKAALETFNPEQTYSVAEAAGLIEKLSTTKFDGSVEVHMNLNIDPRHADQLVRANMTLPHGTGKKVTICAITDAGNDADLKKAGAKLIGGEELIGDIASGKQSLDFDVVVSTPSMMRHLSKAARVLGPKGLMPNPKSGTVGDDLVAIIGELGAGRFEAKNDKQGNVHSVIGKVSFGAEKLAENLEAFINNIKEAKPSGVKSAATFIKSITVTPTMGPGVKIEN